MMNSGDIRVPGCPLRLETSTSGGDRVRPVKRGGSFRRGLTLGVLGGAVIAAYRYFQSRQAAPPPVAEPQAVVFTPTPAPAPAATVEPEPVAEEAPLPPPAAKPKATPRPKKVALPASVDPSDGVCPDSHPVKGKLASGLFHVPGGFAYARTKPDRCYVDVAAAEADGLRPSKR